MKPVREQVMLDGIAATVGPRNVAYGDPTVNLEAAGQLKNALRPWVLRRQAMGNPLPAGEVEALELVLTKIGRILTGEYHRDNYVDGSTYFAIAAEFRAPKPVEEVSRPDKEIEDIIRRRGARGRRVAPSSPVRGKKRTGTGKNSK